MDKVRIEAILEQLSARHPLQALTPTAIWNEQLDRQIAAMAEEKGHSNTELALLSGMHLWNDSLTRSHTISQDIEDATGSYWHGIMHRMEQDYSNAKYWFRLTGEHPAMNELGRSAAQLLQHSQELPALADKERQQLQEIAVEGLWNAYRFVDVVQAVEEGRADSAARPVLQRLQRLEMTVLIGYCQRLL